MLTDQSQGLLLRGAPDRDIGSTDVKSRQVMLLDLNTDVVKELVESVKQGKSPQVLFGRNPNLRVNGVTHVLAPQASKFRQELYKTDSASRHGELEFHALVSHRLTLQKANEALAGMDTALEAFKNTMVSIEQEREARRTIITPDLAPTRKKTKGATSKTFRNSSSLLPSAPSSSTFRQPSPSPKSIHSVDMSSKIHLAAPSSTSTSEEAMRYAMVHLLAMRPYTVQECATKLRAKIIPTGLLLQRVGERDYSAPDLYRLGKRIYREVDPWGFPYKNENNRKAVIDNAIRAFDALRIDPKDSVWQRLLPVSQRNQGITLSKLKLQPGKVPTPAMKAKPLDAKKAPLAKRAEPKAQKAKADKAEPKKAGKAAEAAKATESKKATATAQKSEKAAKPRNASAARNDTAQKTTSTNAKSLLNKPKNPSPLSASPPVNASDFEESHPVHKALAGAPSPTKQSPTKQQPDKPKTIAKRKLADEPSPASKKPRLDSTSQVKDTKPASNAVKAKPKPQTASTKRKADQSESSSSQDNTPLAKMRKGVNGSRIPSVSSTPAKATAPSIKKAPVVEKKPVPQNTQSKPVNGTTSKGKPIPAPVKTNKIAPPKSAKRVETSSPSDVAASLTSPSSPDDPPEMSWRQTIQHAEKFNQYYERYAELYSEIASSPTPPNKAKRAELMKMHERLAVMKSEVIAAVAASRVKGIDVL